MTCHSAQWKRGNENPVPPQTPYFIGYRFCCCTRETFNTKFRRIKFSGNPASRLVLPFAPDRLHVHTFQEVSLSHFLETHWEEPCCLSPLYTFFFFSRENQVGCWDTNNSLKETTSPLLFQPQRAADQIPHWTASRNGILLQGCREQNSNLLTH